LQRERRKGATKRVTPCLAPCDVACEKQQIIHNNNTDMSIDTYKLTSMDEPTDEVLSQLMREAAEEAARKRAEATAQFFNQLKSDAQKIEAVW